MLYAEACRLLTRTDYTAQQIAEVLNFSDQSAFGKFFKSKAGVSPHIFRLKGVNS
ncbi:helix-turn-helix domain-containing protein [Phocaeicola coprocola]|nr:AraC family transcriptional regulator [Phocaeicola coprocola]MBM6713561.1 helix-turn-helix transcriptional regulator [Phocaeicola coprocola]MBM6903242.1 helix-turn-helix transcriptional regulator [Phocaeicola coprocola]